MAQQSSGPEIGLTGARFGGRRRSREVDSDLPDDSATLAFDAIAAAPEADGWVGLTGARFGGSARRRRREVRAAEPRAVSIPVPRLEPLPVEPDPLSSMPVRPYVLTRGRTRSEFELAIETLVSAVPGAGDPGTHRDIVDLCRRPRSVAEVAALRGLPLGVAKVLLGDLAVSGAIAVHRTADAGGSDLALMERVLSGLRRL